MDKLKKLEAQVSSFQLKLDSSSSLLQTLANNLQGLSREYEGIMRTLDALKNPSSLPVISNLISEDEFHALTTSTGRLERVHEDLADNISAFNTKIYYAHAAWNDVTYREEGYNEAVGDYNEAVSTIFNKLMAYAKEQTEEWRKGEDGKQFISYASRFCEVEEIDITEPRCASYLEEKCDFEALDTPDIDIKAPWEQETKEVKGNG